MLRHASLLSSLFVICCGGAADAHRGTTTSPPAEPSEAVESTTTPRVLLDTPIFYEVPEGDSTRTIHTPLIRARVGGIETLLILDTGASDSIFMNTLGDAMGVDREPDEAGTDHSGAAVSTFAATTAVEMQLESLTIPVPRMLFIDGPPPFAIWGIGGIVSPQLLSDSDWVVLDLAESSLRIVEGDETQIANGISESHEGWPFAALPRVGSDGDSARHIIVEGSIADMPARVMINTGGAHTEVAPIFQPDVQGPDVSTGRGVSGAAVRGQHGTGTLACRFGTLELTAEDFVVREQSPASNAQIGIDVLRGDILMFRAASVSNVHWWHAPQ